MKNTILAVAVVAGISLLGGVAAQADNIALNKPVTVVSGEAQIFNPLVSPDVITDGIFTPEDTSYGAASDRAVEWGTTNGGSVKSDNSNTDTVLQITLGGNFQITGAMVQADDNDSYLLQYFNETTNTWDTLWTVPYASTGNGLRTRPGFDHTTFESVGPVVTDAVRISTGTIGDSGMAVSEVQLEGTAVATSVPLPASAWGGFGLLGLISATRLTKRRMA